MVTPKAKREVARMLQVRFRLSLRRSCALVRLWRSTQSYCVKAPNKDDVLKKRMRKLAEENPRSGCPMFHDILRREGFVRNKKRTERVYYREEKLSLRRKKRRRRASHTRLEVPDVKGSNDRWAMDFVHDSLWNGRKLRNLTLIDVFTKEALAIAVDTSISGHGVVRALERVVENRGLPKIITVDNGPEFRSRALDRWAYENRVTLDFIRPGKPVDNCYIESFNSRFREECLNVHYFDTIAEARMLIENWRKKYNDYRPHRTLKGLTPQAFAKQFNKTNTKNLYSEVVQ